MQQASLLDWAWFAGIFEGEGTIVIGATSTGGVRLQVGMTDRDIIERLYEIYPTSSPMKVRVIPPYKTQYIWKTTRAADVRMVLDAMLPWLGERRSAKAREAIVYLDGRPGLGGHWSIRTHCKHGHEYTEENTYRYARTPGIRRCKSCQREREKRYRDANIDLVRRRNLERYYRNKSKT